MQLVKFHADPLKTVPMCKERITDKQTNIFGFMYIRLLHVFDMFNMANLFRLASTLVVNHITVELHPVCREPAVRRRHHSRRKSTTVRVSTARRRRRPAGATRPAAAAFPPNVRPRPAADSRARAPLPTANWQPKYDK